MRGRARLATEPIWLSCQTLCAGVHMRVRALFIGRRSRSWVKLHIQLTDHVGGCAPRKWNAAGLGCSMSNKRSRSLFDERGGLENQKLFCAVVDIRAGGA